MLHTITLVVSSSAKNELCENDIMKSDRLFIFVSAEFIYRVMCFKYRHFICIRSYSGFDGFVLTGYYLGAKAVITVEIFFPFLTSNDKVG